MRTLGMIAIWTVLAAGVPMAAHADNADGISSVVCSKPPGFMGGPFVPTRQVAEAIFRAVAPAIYRGALRGYPLVTVKDTGDHWWVSEDKRYPPQKPQSHDLIVRMGGGQLYMDIDKCTGAISHVAVNR